MTKEIINSIILPSGKINKKMVNELKINQVIDSIYFEIIESEETLFNHMVKTSYIDNNIKTTKKCNICDKPVKFFDILNGYKQLCKGCQRKQTCLEKYGDANYNNSNKMLETKIENDSYTQMVQTHKKTCLEKYGVEHHWLTEDSQEKKINTFIEKYGVDNPMKSSTITDKVKETNLERYGVENVSFNQGVKDKIRNAQLNLNDEEKKVKEMNRQETCFIKYGVSHQMQTGLYTNSGYKWKEYILPSNETIKIQGHEHYLLDELLQEYTEDEIITERRLMPEIWYTGIDGNNHRYFPDMYIPKTNTIYEVKSEYTLNVNLETNNLKFQAVKDAGYNFELRVY